MKKYAVVCDDQPALQQPIAHLDRVDISLTSLTALPFPRSLGHYTYLHPLQTSSQHRGWTAGARYRHLDDSTAFLDVFTGSLPRRGTVKATIQFNGGVHRHLRAIDLDAVLSSLPYMARPKTLPKISYVELAIDLHGQEGLIPDLLTRFLDTPWLRFEWRESGTKTFLDPELSATVYRRGKRPTSRRFVRIYEPTDNPKSPFQELTVDRFTRVELVLRRETLRARGINTLDDLARFDWSPAVRKYLRMRYFDPPLEAILKREGDSTRFYQYLDLRQTWEASGMRELPYVAEQIFEQPNWRRYLKSFPEHEVDGIFEPFHRALQAYDFAVGYGQDGGSAGLGAAMDSTTSGARRKFYLRAPANQRGPRITRETRAHSKSLG